MSDPQPSPAPRAAVLCAALALLGVAALTAYAPTADPDLWWHLRIGEQAVLRRSTLPRELFSYRFAGQPWPYKDLIADILLWLSWRGAGFFGFYLLKLGAGLALGLSAWLALPRRQPEVILLTGGLMIASLGLVERPNLFSLALFPVLLGLLERARRGAAEPSLPMQLRRALGLVLLVFGWALLHRAAVLGMVLLGLHAAYLGLARVVTARGTWPRLAALFGVAPSRAAVLAALGAAVAAPLCGLLNPSGLALYRTSIGVAQSPLLRRFITEWLPVDPAWFLRTPGGWLSLVAAPLCMIVLARAFARAKAAPLCLWHAGLLGLFAVRLFLDSVRWQPYLICSAALVIGLCCDALADRLLRADLPAARRPLLCVLGGVLLCALQAGTRPDPLAYGPSPSLQPAGAVTFARDNHLSGAVLNAYGLGGSLIHALWPETQVLVDGRNDQIYPAPFVEDALLAQQDPQRFAALHKNDPATWVMAWNRPDHVSHAFLAQDPAWALVYLDDVAAVYVLRAAHPALAARAYRLLDPAALEASVARTLARHRDEPAVLDALEAELLRLWRAAPQSLRANGALLIYYARRGPADRRDALLRHIDGFAPDHPALTRLRAHLGLPVVASPP